MMSLTRRQFFRLGVAGSIGGLVGCQDQNYSIFGYALGNKPLYDTNIQTVFVHTFYNRTLQTTPYRGLEVSITQEVVHQIGQKTPYRILSDISRADTELFGTIVNLQKNILNVTQQNQVREGELAVTVEVVWRDLRDGRILSAPKKRRPQNSVPTDPNPGMRQPTDAPVFDEQVSQPPDRYEVPKAEPVRITATGRYIAELGESNASAEQKIEYNIATMIVSLMEKRW
jgi:hypothetical protein